MAGSRAGSERANREPCRYLIRNPTRAGDGWPGIAEEISRSKYVIFGLILVGIMLLRPQGLLPSQIRKQELKHEEHEALTVPRQLQS